MKYISKILIIITLLLVAGSCTNLDERIYSDVLKSDFFQSEEMLIRYSGRAYKTLQNYCTEQSLWTLILQTSDECCVPANASGEWKQERYAELQRHNFVISNKLIRTGWDFCFNGVVACNDVIFRTEQSEIDFNGKDRVLSEMKVLRAFYYFMAMDGWANIPFSIDPTDKSNPPQKDRTFIFDFIETEILDNVANLSSTPNSVNYGRITQGMAYTLLAKLYLNAEEFIGANRYADAETACLNVINEGNYIIENDYKANFIPDNEFSRENIFVIPYSSVYVTEYDNSFLIYMLALANYNKASFNLVANPWDGFVCQPDFFQSYDSSDLRLPATFLYGQQKDINGNNITDAILEPIFSDNLYASGRGLYDGARLWKWSYQSNGQITSECESMENDFAIFRYSDVLLMYAEALLRQGKSVAAATSNADFISIRTRAGLTPLSASATLDDIYLERSHELAWEGWKRQDMIRFGKWSNAWWGKPATSANKKLFPIPLERLNANPNLIQNPL